MSGGSRTKKATYALLNNEARQRIINPRYVSSGSEHSAEADLFSDMFFNFAADRDESPPSLSPDEDRPAAKPDPNVADLIRPIVEDKSDEFRNALKVHVLRALQMFDEKDEQVLRRKVMGHLRELGYDAAVCMTKWKGGGGVAAGEYEFLEVVVSAGDLLRVRYLVDVDFRSEFELARPTGSYQLGLQSLPRVFVGRSEELKEILRVMSDAAKRSFKSRGLLTPPWRKHRFLLNKWLGGHRRAVTVHPTETSSRDDGVSCRLVGFAAARRREEVS